eukprot:gnl/MRDRNA2_/MRDRNA2_154259_c0_seq1.p1 gnl/MRDRNA2_/MRDRNA2_154259_c0~~gnl/MRDRNA2_/MRDRNA2_154259_c0_seq1.p1  ORF type:complete len:383 (-),score=57.98 gnl/MRDRNA2_/MRDRNA2_154259_c0_seq1:71-1186(-)
MQNILVDSTEEYVNDDIVLARQVVGGLSSLYHGSGHTQFIDAAKARTYHRPGLDTATMSKLSHPALVQAKPGISSVRLPGHRTSRVDAANIKHAARHLAGREAAKKRMILMTRRVSLLTASYLIGAYMMPPTGWTQPVALESAAEASSPPLSLFKGKADFSFEYPSDWFTAFNRLGGSGGGQSLVGGQTLALVGDFKKFDTITVRRESLSKRQDFWDAAASPGSLAEKAAQVAKVEVPRARTESERDDLPGPLSILEQSNGFVAVQVGGASALDVDGQLYFIYEYYTEGVGPYAEICRGTIEVGKNGVKRCLVGVEDLSPNVVVKRRHVAVATAVDDYLYLVKASALESRWPEVGSVLSRVASSFRVRTSK